MLIGVNLNEYFTIESSHSAAAVLTDPKSLDADFLICDIDFESETVNGIDVVKHFRENSNGVKIALHSNRIEQSIDDIVQALNLTFLSKPIDEFELLNFLSSTHTRKILLVEDSPLMISRWKTKLRACIDVVSNMVDLNSLMESGGKVYDLVILDRYINGVDCLELNVASKLKTIHSCPLVLSSNSNLDDTKSCLEGVDLEIGKEPLSYDEIIAMLKGL